VNSSPHLLVAGVSVLVYVCTSVRNLNFIRYIKNKKNETCSKRCFNTLIANTANFGVMVRI